MDAVCQCGCGRPVPLAKKTSTKWGIKKGQPIRFLLGHGRWKFNRIETCADTQAARFLSKIKIIDKCWLWTGATNEHGYGKLSANGSWRLAHRVSWNLSNGEIPDNLQVLHRCDTPACVNPAHLFLGTHADNMRDMKQKGRWKWKARISG